MNGYIQLQDSFKSYTYDQDKNLSPEETVARVRQRFASVDMDILENTMRIDTGRLDIPVYISLCGADAVVLTGTRKQRISVLQDPATTKSASSTSTSRVLREFGWRSPTPRGGMGRRESTIS